jgi:hypothetical protein
VQTGPTGSGDIYYQAGRLTAIAVDGTYAYANRYGWGRASLMQQVTNRKFESSASLLLGAEFTGQGNYDVRQYQGGGVIGVGFPHSRASLQLHGGYAYLRFSDGSTARRPYLGMGLYRAF